MRDLGSSLPERPPAAFGCLHLVLDAIPRCAALFVPVRDGGDRIRTFRAAALNRAATRPGALRVEIGEPRGADTDRAHLALDAAFCEVLRTGEPLVLERHACRGSSGSTRSIDVEAGKLGDGVLCAWIDRGPLDDAPADTPDPVGAVPVLLDSMSQMAWLKDASGHTYWYNRRWYEYTGTTPEQMEGWGWTQVHHPDHVDRVVASLRHCLASGEPWDITFPLRGADGGYRWFLTRAEPIRDADGGIRRWFGTNTDITEQRRTEAALRESEERLRLAAEATGLGTYDYDVGAGRAVWSDELRRIVGVEATGPVDPHRELLDRIHPADRERCEAEFARSLAAEGAERHLLEFRILRPDGGIRWLRDAGRAIFEDIGGRREAVRVVGTIVDVTAEKAAVDVQQRSDRFVRGVLDRLFVFVGVLEPDGTVTDVNRLPLEVADIAVGDVRGRRFWDCPWWSYDAEVRARLRDAVARAAAGEMVRYDAPMRVAGDGRMWVDFQIAPLLDDAGEVTHLIASGMDLTARMRAEQAVQASEARFRHLADAMPQLVWTADESGVADYYSEQVARYDGIERRPDGSWTWQPVVHDEDVAATLSAWQEAIATGRIYECEHRVRMADGSMRWHLSRALNHDGRWIGTATDIHALKLAEAELAETSRRKDEFLAVLGHELRNPLAPIRAAIDVLSRAGHDPRVLDQTLPILERQTLQLIALIDDLLDVSRITRGTFQLRRAPVGVADVMQSAVEAATPAIQERAHRFDVSVPDAALLVDGDFNRLVQVLTNLLSNAAKYTPRGGHVSMIGERVGDAVEIAVIDDGIGIAADLAERIFEMFARVVRPEETAAGGLGVGLTLAKSLVELHGGTVDVASEGEGRGATFRIRLPLAERLPGAAPDVVGGAGEHRSRRSLRVLVVDDNVEAARMLAMLLELRGDEVRLAHDGLQACELAEDDRPDVVVMDLGMPVMDGYAAARRLRERPWGRDLVLVALSGWGQQADREKSSRAGFDHHLVKPADQAVLDEILGRVAGGGSRP